MNVFHESEDLKTNATLMFVQISPLEHDMSKTLRSLNFSSKEKGSLKQKSKVVNQFCHHYSHLLKGMDEELKLTAASTTLGKFT